jgi:hypothetical protein
MTIFLYCEGAADYAVIPLLMKKVSNIHDLDVQWIKRDQLNKYKTHRKSSVDLPRHYKYIYALANYSDEKGIKCIAYHRDADNNYNNVYNEINSQLNVLRKEGYICLAMVPKEMLESWLLADVKAINKLGDGKRNIDQSPEPEDLWGDKNDPNSNYPKNYLIRNLAELGLESNRDTYAQIAENADIEVLKRRCPKSFGRFWEDMQGFCGRV